MQGCAAPRSVDFQRLRSASGQHSRAYVFPRSVLYAVPRLRVYAFTRAEYRGRGRRRDHGATTGRVILPVRAAGRGWRRDSGTTWKWLDMTDEEITR